MAQIIEVRALEAGDRFYNPRRPDLGLNRVESTRFLHVSGTNYAHLTFLAIRGDERVWVETDFIATKKVIRVSAIDYPMVNERVSTLRNGGHLMLWRGEDGRLYS